MKIKYLLNEDIIARAATQLNFEITKISAPVYIEKEERLINAKSIIGLLSGDFRKGETITIDFSDEEKDAEKIREIFDTIGREI